MQEVFKRIALAAQGDVPVLLTGESGTGKELAAAAIHFHSTRREQAYVPVTLPALSENLIESELFGHVRGAFTGANENREGYSRRHRVARFCWMKSAIYRRLSRSSSCEC